MRIYLKLCNESGIHFQKFKYRIPSSASKRNNETVGYQQIDWIGYADDLILIFDSKKDLQIALTILDTLFVKFGLSIMCRSNCSLSTPPHPHPIHHIFFGCPAFFDHIQFRCPG